MKLGDIVEAYLRRKYPPPSEAEIRAEVAEEVCAIARKRGGRYTRGNVRIQKLAFLSSEDQKRLSEKLRSKYAS